MPEVLIELLDADRLDPEATVDRLSTGVRADRQPAVIEAFINDIVAVQVASQCDVRSHHHRVWHAPATAPGFPASGPVMGGGSPQLLWRTPEQAPGASV